MRLEGEEEPRRVRACPARMKGGLGGMGKGRVNVGSGEGGGSGAHSFLVATVGGQPSASSFEINGVPNLPNVWDNRTRAQRKFLKHKQKQQTRCWSWRDGGYGNSFQATCRNLSTGWACGPGMSNGP